MPKLAASRSHGPNGPLTAIDEELIRGIAQGWSNKRIAQARCRSAATVRNQMHALFRKLGVRSRAAALAVTLSRGAGP